MTAGEIGDYLARVAKLRCDGIKFIRRECGYMGFGSRANGSVEVDLVRGNALYQAFDRGNLFGISIQTTDEQNFKPYQSCKFISEGRESRYQLFYANISMGAVNLAESLLVAGIERWQDDVGLGAVGSDIVSEKKCAVCYDSQGNISNFLGGIQEFA